jgi:hypothetical protein
MSALSSRDFSETLFIRVKVKAMQDRAKCLGEFYSLFIKT